MLDAQAHSDGTGSLLDGVKLPDLSGSLRPTATGRAGTAAGPADWRQQLHRLAPLGLPLLPIGAGAESKGPINPAKGGGLVGWETAAYSAQQIQGMPKRVRGVGFRTGAGRVAIDVDGATGVELCIRQGCDPAEAQTWRIDRDTDPNRLKLCFTVTPEQADQLGELITKAHTKPAVKDADGKVTEKAEAVEVFHHTGKQVVVLGEHVVSGGNYGWPAGHGPEALAPIPPNWWALVLAIKAKELGLSTGPTQTPLKPLTASARPTPATDLPPRPETAITDALTKVPTFTHGEGRRAELVDLALRLWAEVGRDRAYELLAEHSPGLRDMKGYFNTEPTKIHHGSLWPWLREKYGVDIKRHDLGSQRQAAEQDAAVGGFRVWTEDELAAEWAREVARRQQQAKPEPELQSYGQLIATTLQAIRDAEEDAEMEARAELKHRFRVSDEQIGTALFKRHSAEKVQKVAATHDSVDMTHVEQLDYLMDGWILKGDLMLTYGSYGTGKTTLALAKLHAHVTGTNLLDRDTPCTPGKGLFIATDSGTGPLKKAMQDLRMDPDNSTLMAPGHPDQRIWVWGHEPGQGQSSWVCDIHGVIRLEQFIKKHGITYVVIDSAKSVSSAAGWSYTSNESVAALLKYLREGVAQPHGCCIEFLSHDGTEKGSHSGAKKWAEDPSMVCALTPALNPDTNQFEGVIAEFRKDRAAHVDARRTLRFGLNDGRLELHPDVEVVSSCADAVLTILWEAHQRGVSSVSGRELKAEAVARFNRSHKTVENTLGKITGTGKGPNPSPVVRPRHGAYALSPKEIQKRAGGEQPLPNRTLSLTGGVSSKPTAAQGVWTPPIETPDGGFGGLPIPPIPPVGVSIGGSQIAGHDSDLGEIPPGGEGIPPQGEPENRPAPAWLPLALELRDANPGQPPAVLVNLLYAKGVPGVTGAAIKAALADHDQQQLNP